MRGFTRRRTCPGLMPNIKVIYLWWIVLWDHWQPSLKALVLCQRGIAPRLRLDVEEKRWDESSDEEVYMDE